MHFTVLLASALRESSIKDRNQSRGWRIVNTQRLSGKNSSKSSILRYLTILLRNKKRRMISLFPVLYLNACKLIVQYLVNDGM